MNNNTFNKSRKVYLFYERKERHAILAKQFKKQSHKLSRKYNILEDKKDINKYTDI